MYKISTLAKGTFKSSATSATFTLGGPNILHVAIFAVAGAYFIYAGIIPLAVASFVKATLSLATNNGIELDLRTRQYRLYTSILGFKIGDWDTIPTVQHITMKYFSDLVTSGKEGRMRTDQDKRYIVMFSVLDSPQGSIVYETEKYDVALSLTSFLADALNVEAKLYDHV